MTTTMHHDWARLYGMYGTYGSNIIIIVVVVSSVVVVSLFLLAACLPVNF